jgi:hypothetical protein
MSDPRLCSKCHKAPPRAASQRYCAVCHAAAARARTARCITVPLVPRITSLKQALALMALHDAVKLDKAALAAQRRRARR